MSASRPRPRRDSSPRKIRVAAAAVPRLVSTEDPRRGRGVAAIHRRNIRAANARRLGVVHVVLRERDDVRVRGRARLEDARTARGPVVDRRVRVRDLVEELRALGLAERRAEHAPQRRRDGRDAPLVVRHAVLADEREAAERVRHVRGRRERPAPEPPHRRVVAAREVLVPISFVFFVDVALAPLGLRRRGVAEGSPDASPSARRRRSVIEGRAAASPPARRCIPLARSQRSIAPRGAPGARPRRRRDPSPVPSVDASRGAAPTAGPSRPRCARALMGRRSSPTGSCSSRAIELKCCTSARGTSSRRAAWLSPARVHFTRVAAPTERGGRPMCGRLCVAGWQAQSSPAEADQTRLVGARAQRCHAGRSSTR